MLVADLEKEAEVKRYEAELEHKELRAELEEQKKREEEAARDSREGRVVTLKKRNFELENRLTELVETIGKNERASKKNDRELARLRRENEELGRVVASLKKRPITRANGPDRRGDWSVQNLYECGLVLRKTRRDVDSGEKEWGNYKGSEGELGGDFN